MLDPLGGLDLGIGYESATSYPAPGQLLFHPGGISETEILLAYGSVRFASKVGQLAGNHFLTIIEGVEHLPELGRSPAPQRQTRLRPRGRLGFRRWKPLAGID